MSVGAWCLLLTVVDVSPPPSSAAGTCVAGPTGQTRLLVLDGVQHVEPRSAAGGQDCRAHPGEDGDEREAGQRLNRKCHRGEVGHRLDGEHREEDPEPERAGTCPPEYAPVAPPSPRRPGGWELSAPRRVNLERGDARDGRARRCATVRPRKCSLSRIAALFRRQAAECSWQ